MMFRTMLVEDSAPFRQLIKDTLQDQFRSMNIIEAGGGVEALQKIDSHPPNLIFMDIQLPGGNGLELTRKIKADYPDVIIIILTNHDLPEYREAAARNKADYFFSKDSIATDGIFKLVKSILLEKGFNSEGSGEIIKGGEVNKKILNPEKYGMIVCQSCMSKGFVLKPKRQRCPNCGGFGFIKKEAKENNISTSHSLNAKHISDEE